MIFLLIALAVVFIIGLRPAKLAGFNNDYMSIPNTNVIKGVFIVLVFMSHTRTYIEWTGAFNTPYIEVQNFLGQMIVAMFLFYSGYGIMESIQKKGSDYVMGIPTKRFLKVLVLYDVAVLIYLIADLCLGKIGTEYSIMDVLLSFTGWTNIGNSNWYMLVIFLLYLLTFVSFFFIKWCKKRWGLYIGALIMTILTIGLCVVFYFTRHEITNGAAYEYSTTLLYVFGMWYSLLKPKIEKVVMHNIWTYLVTILVWAGLFAVMINVRKLVPHVIWLNGVPLDGLNQLFTYVPWGIVFVMAIVLFTMKFSFKNKPLEWCGKHLFSLYIFQRLPMMILATFGVNKSNPYLFVGISLVVTFLIAWTFDKVTKKIMK